MQNYSREIETISRGLFPPGVRFHPTDEELIVYYLENKVNSRPLPTCLIGEIELCNYNPWELPNKALYGEDEWYFFTPRDRKYPNGVRPNRAAGSGFWKATGTDKAILNSSGSRIGVKKALVFYSGKASDGVKTEWIMTEYRMPDTIRQSSRSEVSMRLDDWVLCRIRRKGNTSNNAWEVQQTSSNMVEYLPKIMELPSVPTGGNTETCPNYFLPKDCSLLAALLSGQELPGVENIPSTSENSNISKNLDADYEHVPDKGILVTNSIFQDFFNSSKGKAFEANELYENVHQPTKWINTETHSKDFISSDQPTTSAASFYDQYQSQGGVNFLP